MPAPPVPGVLFVCEGNICRSPVAELLLRGTAPPPVAQRAARIGSRSASARGILVASAGLRAVPGQPIDPHMAALLVQAGVEAEHAARQVTAALVQAAGLVVTMTRDQRGDVVDLVPAQVHATYTLRELAAIAVHVPPVLEGDAAFEWVSAHRGEVVSRLDPASLDIADPLGRGRRVAADCFELIRGAVRDVQVLLPRLLGGDM